MWHAVGGLDAIVDSTRMSFNTTTPALGEHLNRNSSVSSWPMTYIHKNKEHVNSFNSML